MQHRSTGSFPEANLVGGKGTGVELGADVAPDGAAVYYPVSLGKKEG